MSDPLSGSPFPGNVIPQSRKDPAAVRFLALMPAPNAAGTRNATYGIDANNWVRPTTDNFPMKDYRDRYEELTGCSLRQCPQCQHGRMVLLAILPKSPDHSAVNIDSS